MSAPELVPDGKDHSQTYFQCGECDKSFETEEQFDEHECWADADNPKPSESVAKGPFSYPREVCSACGAYGPDRAFEAHCDRIDCPARTSEPVVHMSVEEQKAVKRALLNSVTVVHKGEPIALTEEPRDMAVYRKMASTIQLATYYDALRAAATSRIAELERKLDEMENDKLRAIGLYDSCAKDLAAAQEALKEEKEWSNRNYKECFEAAEAELAGVRAVPVDLIKEQGALANPAHQVFFRAGLLACREYMARFVEPQSPTIAASIRANWWPDLGQDFGPPRLIEWNELTEGEYGEASFRCKEKEEISPTVEALPIALKFLHRKDTDTTLAASEEEGK